MGARTIQNVHPVYRRFSCEAIKIFSRMYKSSAAAYDIASLCSVNYFEISRGSVSCDHHLGLLSSVVRHHRPPHLIACLGGMI